jgi:hypothetical protein
MFAFIGKIFARAQKPFSKQILCSTISSGNFSGLYSTRKIVKCENKRKKKLKLKIES